jgi:hypothetical protein
MGLLSICDRVTGDRVIVDPAICDLAIGLSM